MNKYKSFCIFLRTHKNINYNTKFHRSQTNFAIENINQQAYFKEIIDYTVNAELSEWFKIDPKDPDDDNKTPFTNQEREYITQRLIDWCEKKAGKQCNSKI